MPKSCHLGGASQGDALAGITSGYLPLGATMVCNEIAELIEHAGYFAHGFTYSGQPTTAAAALGNIDVIEKENLVARIRDDTGPYFQEKLRSFANHRAVGEVRGCGLIGTLELVPRAGNAALTPTGMLGGKAVNLIRAEGVIVRRIRDLTAFDHHPHRDRPAFRCGGQRLDRLWDWPWILLLSRGKLFSGQPAGRPLNIDPIK